VIFEERLEMALCSPWNPTKFLFKNCAFQSGFEEFIIYLNPVLIPSPLKAE